MIKVRPSQVFDFDTEDLVAEGGQRTSDTPPAPTMDDRANLYLNAVYGAREFKGEEHAYARRIILEAMTIDAGVGHEDIVEDVPAHENSVPSDRHHAAFSAFEPSFADAYIPRQLSEAVNKFEPEPFDKDFEWEPDVSAARVSRGPRRFLPQYHARERSSILFTAIASSLASAAIATVTLLLVLPNMRTETTGTRIALSPAEIQTLLSSGTSLKVVETAATRPLASEFAGRLLDLGSKLVAAGDLYGGRLILQEAANEGQASAAFALAATFDPIEVKTLGQPDSSPDLEKARAWYLKAKQLGSTEAQVRLDRLAKNSR
jgi:hypothetical protein